jgi:hypothetical protein
MILRGAEEREELNIICAAHNGSFALADEKFTLKQTLLRDIASMRVCNICCVFFKTG